MQKYRKLQQTYFINVIIINLVSIVFLGSIWAIYEIYQYKQEVKTLRETFIENQKTIIKNEVENAIEYIDKVKKETDNDLKRILQIRTKFMHSIVASLYSSHSHYSDEQKKAFIFDVLKQINSNSTNNYIYIITPNYVKDLNTQSANLPTKQRTDLEELRDTVKKLQTKNQTFLLNNSLYTNIATPQKMILYLEEFKTLNWIVCGGIDYNAYASSSQKDLILRLSHIRFGKNRDGYLFANVQNADPLLTNGIITIGQANNWELEDPHGVKIMEEQYKAAQKPEGDYIKYSWRKIFTNEEKAYGVDKPTSPKISFVKGYKPWNWMIGAGFYLDDIDIEIARKRLELYDIIKKHTVVIVLSLIVSIFFSLIVVRLIQKKLNLSYSRFFNFFNEASSGNAKIDAEQLFYQEFKNLAHYANRMVDQREMAEQGFKQIVEVFPFPICIFQKNTVLYLNPQWINIIGYDLDQIPTLPRMLVKCFADKDERRLIQNLTSAEILSPTAEDETLFKILCNDGTVRFMKLNYIEMKNHNSMITLEDYSLRKKVEDDLNAARMKAEESDSLKSAFLANMSHEIRTPMNAIIGFSGLLQNENMPAEKRKRYLALIHKSSESLLNLINDILDISKIEAGQMNFHIHSGNLADTFAIVDAETKSIQATLGKENIEIITSYALSPEESIIETDFLRLKQVLMNLLSNALKFTNEGKIEYGCKIVKTNTIEFFVKDTGIGIKPSHLTYIFNRFTKIEEDRTKLLRGAGLGLSISKKIVEHLGGKINVKSTFGQGSTFYFTLPIKFKGQKTNKG